MGSATRACGDAVETQGKPMGEAIASKNLIGSRAREFRKFVLPAAAASALEILLKFNRATEFVCQSQF